MNTMYYAYVEISYVMLYVRALICVLPKFSPTYLLKILKKRVKILKYKHRYVHKNKILPVAQMVIANEIYFLISLVVEFIRVYVIKLTPKNLIKKINSF